jgi:signal transduction histidine kinase
MRVPHFHADLAGLRVGSEDFLAAILERAAQPICVVDDAGRIRFANPAALAALRCHSGDHPSMVLPPAADQTLTCDLDWFVRGDGSTLPVSYVSMPIEMPEGRLAVLTFADAEDRVRADRLRREHEAILAAQRRLATLVAGGAESADVFAAIAEQVGDLIGIPLVVVWRYEADATGTVIGVWSDHAHPFEPGSCWPLDGGAVCALLRTTARPARVEDFAGVQGTIAEAQRDAGVHSCAGAPIIVDGEVWGAISVLSTETGPLPGEIEYRLAEITELVGTAISNSASREELARLANQEAALRRVATLVAHGVPPPDVFAAVTREVGLLLEVDAAHMARYEVDGTSTSVAAWSLVGDHMPVGKRVALRGGSVTGMVFRTGRPARIHNYEEMSGAGAALGRELGLRSSVGAPIVVDKRLWGVMIASSKHDRKLSADTESRVAAFTELVATAISNTETRTEATRLAEEQAALRRVATLVARAVPQGELFSAVIAEAGSLFGADLTGMIRYESDGMVTPVAAWAAAGEHPPLPERWPIEEGDPAMLVATTRRPERIDDWSAVPGPIAAFVRAAGVSSSVGSPILVEGRLWGAMAVHTTQREPLPPDTESRLENFAELVATAISNAEARADLAASRARVVAAADEERRQVVRDLHDGAQQRLVQTILTLRLAHEALARGEELDVPAVLAEALDDAAHANEELRELAHGILPAALSHGGLRAGVRALASRMPLPVENRVSAGRLPPAIEAAAYFVVAEALTNIAKHACAQHATVSARVEHRTLRVRVRDDGIGGARTDGTGLVGLADRMAAVDGQLRIESPAGGGTLVAADFPLPDGYADR